MRLDLLTTSAGMTATAAHQFGLIDALGTLFLGLGTFMAASVAAWRFIREQRAERKLRGKA